MQILGIRTSSKCVRYAVLEWDGENALFVNAELEHKLVFPAEYGADGIDYKLEWLYSELDRIYRLYPDIQKVAIKMNQYGMEKKPARYSTNMDGVVMLSAKQNGKQVKTFLYTSIEKGMSSSKIKDFSESIVGRSGKYWDNQMADAVAVAWRWRM